MSNSNSINNIWEVIFPLKDASSRKDMSDWDRYLFNAKTLYNILDPNWGEGRSCHGFFSYFASRNDNYCISSLRRDKTIVSASNTLHQTLLSYLWGQHGGNVFLNNRVFEEEVVPSSEFSKITRSLQESVALNTVMADCISVALKNAIDYGNGYVIGIKGRYDVVNPCFVSYHRTPVEGKLFYILDCGSYYWIFGRGNELAKFLDINLDKEFFAIRYVFDGDFVKGKRLEKRYEVFTDSYPMLFHLKLPYYRNSLMASGCGIESLNSVDLCSELAELAICAQEIEMSPPISIAGVAKSCGAYGDRLKPGGRMTYDHNIISPDHLVYQHMYTRGVNAMVYLDGWRQVIRNFYFLDQLAIKTNAQVTSIESSQNAQATNSVIEAAVNPFFNGFMKHFMRNFVRYHFKKNVPDGYKAIINKLDFKFVGLFTSDILKADLQTAGALVQTVSALSKIDPNSVLFVNTVGILEKLSSDSIPTPFYRTTEEVMNLYNQIREQQQQNQQAPSIQQQDQEQNLGL